MFQQEKSGFGFSDVVQEMCIRRGDARHAFQIEDMLMDWEPDW
jgi:hypothetical protein